MRTPAEATMAKRIKVAPPRTGLGIIEKTAPSTGNILSRTKIPAMYLPTWRDATPVSWITPLFWLKVARGKAEKIAASRGVELREYQVNLDENPFLADHFGLGDDLVLILFHEGRVIARWEDDQTTE